MNSRVMMFVCTPFLELWDIWDMNDKVKKLCYNKQQHLQGIATMPYSVVCVKLLHRHNIASSLSPNQLFVTCHLFIASASEKKLYGTLGTRLFTYIVTLHKESTKFNKNISVDQLISAKQFMHDCGKQSQTWYKYVQWWQKLLMREPARRDTT